MEEEEEVRFGRVRRMGEGQKRQDEKREKAKSDWIRGVIKAYRSFDEVHPMLCLPHYRSVLR